MHYDIKIKQGNKDNSLLEFDRLNLLTKSTKDIATKSLMFKLKGVSDIKPDKDLKQALSMRLQNISKNNGEDIILTVDCKPFSETINEIQLDFFNPQNSLLELTPMALVINAFHSALNNKEGEAELDKPLLKSLYDFKMNFINEKEVISLANRGTTVEVQLKKDDFEKIKTIEESIPESQKVLINGLLDELKLSKGRLGIQTEQGLVHLITTDRAMIKEISKFIGQEITLSGIANFNLKGQLSNIEVQQFRKPEENDVYFSKKPVAMTAKQQMFFKLKKNKKNQDALKTFKNLSGLMKDEIDDEHFKQILKDIRR